MKNSRFQNIKRIAQKYRGDLHLLFLFGSRAQGIARKNSDWDFAYTADKNFDPMPLLVDLQILLETDKVDLVDLERASGLLRFRAIKDSLFLFEIAEGEYQKLWLEVVNFWCDTHSLFQTEYESLLKELDRGVGS